MKIVIGCDHAGVKAKNEVIDVLENIACSYTDLGVFSEDKSDYPLIAKEVSEKVLTEDFDFGILICGSGTGMTIAANRFKGIRAVLCYDIYSAKMSRIDNDCNILCLRAREFDTSKYYEIIREFLETGFSEEIRHKNRINLLDTISNLEKF